MKAFLKTVSIFEALPDSEIDRLPPLIREKECLPGQVIFRENDPGKTIFIVFSGTYSLFMSGQKIADFRAGDVFGEIALINDQLRSGKVVANAPGKLLEIKGKDLVDPSLIESASSLKIIRKLARQVTSYLKSSNFITTTELIKLGENDRVEFKSSLRYNYFSQKFGREIEHAALKTIAAFLNSKGGTLLIGIGDSGEVKGIDQDKFENDDKALLHLTTLINERIGSSLNSFVSATIEELEGRKVIRVDVMPSAMPAYLVNNNEEHFFVRTGPSTVDLKASEIFLYIYNRFFTALINHEFPLSGDVKP